MYCVKLAASFKSIRIDAVAAIQEISAELVKRAELEATAESRKAFVDSCSNVTTLGVSTCDLWPRCNAYS